MTKTQATTPRFASGAGHSSAQDADLGSLLSEMQALFWMLPGMSGATSLSGMSSAEADAARLRDDAEIEEGFDNMPV